MNVIEDKDYSCESRSLTLNIRLPGTNTRTVMGTITELGKAGEAKLSNIVKEREQ